MKKLAWKCDGKYFVNISGNLLQVIFSALPFRPFPPLFSSSCFPKPFLQFSPNPFSIFIPHSIFFTLSFQYLPFTLYPSTLFLYPFLQFLPLIPFLKFLSPIQYSSPFLSVPQLYSLSVNFFQSVLPCSLFPLPFPLIYSL